VIMGTCIYLTSYATDVNILMIYRFISGLGLGMAESFLFFALPSLIAGIITLKISAKTIS